MSKICIAVICSKDVILDVVLQDLREVLKESLMDVSYTLAYDEQFLKVFDKQKYLILNISDYGKNNCEMLLLPDNCLFNGHINSIHFAIRLNYLKRLLEIVLKHSRYVDLFIGESGTHYDEFTVLQLDIRHFSVVTKILNSINPPDLHIILEAQAEQSDGSVATSKYND